MGADKFYMIPFLSKELNLLGYPKLPYKVKSKTKRNNQKNNDSSDEFSDTCTKENSDSTEISFHSKRMMQCLITVCAELVKDIKSSSFKDDCSKSYDKMNFEYCNLQKQMNVLNKDLQQKLRIIADENEKSRQLKVKINDLERKLKTLEKEKFKIIQEAKSNEEIMKHKTRRMENDLIELHRLLYKQSNIVNTQFLPQNFEIIHLKQPDFKKLWSHVKYARNDTKEALQKAVCIFQENNMKLLTDLSVLKTLLFHIIEEINYCFGYFSKKMNLPFRSIDEKNIKEIFALEKGLQAQKYKDIIRVHFQYFIDIIKMFDECSFSIDNDTFVCLTDIANKARVLYKEQDSNVRVQHC